jgi:cation diffusion facilitator CzcD-associated flavoprotein CzcO
VLAFAMKRPTVMGQMQKNLAEKHLKDSIEDPDLRARLTPDYVMGCKRLLFSDEWYPALTQPNVELVTDGLAEVRPHSIVTVDGREREVDTIIFGTGFKATDRPFAGRVHGSGGLALADAWRDGMSAYLGTTVSGFPNLFLLLGPNTTLGHSSMTLMIEAQVRYVLGALRKLDRKGLASVDVLPQAQAAWASEVQARLDGTVWNAGGCSSWYRDPTGRNTTIWPTYTWRFRRQAKRFDLGAYDVVEAGAVPPTPAAPATPAIPASSPVPEPA